MVAVGRRGIHEQGSSIYPRKVVSWRKKAEKVNWKKEREVGLGP
jgi:hypothetical protein